MKIADRSLVEVEYILEIVNELKFINEKKWAKIEEQRKEVAIMLKAFISSIRKKA